MSQERESSKIVRGKYLVTDADTVILSGALYIEGEEIVDLGDYGRISKEHSADEILGSPQSLVTPGFVNAHGHGKGITDFQRGAIDNTLETWGNKRYPYIDRYYDTLWGAIRLLECGVTTTMHNHAVAQPEAYLEEFCTTVQAYLDSGIRLAFAPSVFDQNIFVYGRSREFRESLPSSLQAWANDVAEKMTGFGPEAYFRAIAELQATFASAQVMIMHGPSGPQWVTDEVLREIKRQAQREDTRIHIHVLQTQLQKLYGRRRYGKSLLAHLSDLEFLGEDVTCGHCVWVSESDIELLSETKTSVTILPTVIIFHCSEGLEIEREQAG